MWRNLPAGVIDHEEHVQRSERDRCSYKSVLHGHLANEGPKFQRNWAAAWPPQCGVSAGANTCANPRCQRSTVSGFTMRSEVRQPLNHRHAKIQKRRSTSSRRGRGMRRCRTSSCCRRQRLSAISSAFGQLQQAPTANSEALPLPLLLNRQEADAVQCRQWEWPLRITILRPSGGWRSGR